jgi:hypothetical protein
MMMGEGGQVDKVLDKEGYYGRREFLFQPLGKGDELIMFLQLTSTRSPSWTTRPTRPTRRIPCVRRLAFTWSDTCHFAFAVSLFNHTPQFKSLVRLSPCFRRCAIAFRVALASTVSRPVPKHVREIKSQLRIAKNKAGEERRSVEEGGECVTDEAKGEVCVR